jgi:hypothetical protein
MIDEEGNEVKEVKELKAVEETAIGEIGRAKLRRVLARSGYEA